MFLIGRHTRQRPRETHRVREALHSHPLRFTYKDCWGERVGTNLPNIMDATVLLLGKIFGWRWASRSPGRDICVGLLARRADTCTMVCDTRHNSWPPTDSEQTIESSSVLDRCDLTGRQLFRFPGRRLTTLRWWGVPFTLWGVSLRTRGVAWLQTDTVGSRAAIRYRRHSKYQTQ